MGRKTAVSVKRSGSRSAGRPRGSAKAGEGGSVDVPDEDEELEKLVKRHRSGDRTASWELGRLASQRLGHTEKKPASRADIGKLAEDIGLITPIDESQSGERRDESSLRQLMKFARRAREKQAQALKRAEIPWRGIVYWLGVEDRKHRSELYKEMIKGLTNSTEIRRYIAKRFRKPAPPRRHADLTVMCTTAQEASETLVATLQNLNERIDERNQEGPKGKAKRLRATQKRHLEATLRDAAKRARATRSKLVSCA